MDTIYQTSVNEEVLSYSIGFYVGSVVFLALRLLTITWILRRVRWDDILMLVTFIIYTIFLGLVNASGRYQTNRFPDWQLASILSNQDDVNSRVIGSKLVMALEQTMLLTLWGIKGCIVGFMCPLLDQTPGGQKMLVLITLLVCTGFIMIEIGFFGVFCVPFREYWSIPVTNPQCASYQGYSVIHLTFNFGSYGMIFLVVVFWIFYLRLPMRRVLVTMSFGCIWIAIIVIAVGGRWIKVSNSQSTLSPLWSIMETSLAMWVANAICLWPLIRKLFRCRSFDPRRSFYVVREPGVARQRAGSSVSWWSTWLRRGDVNAVGGEEHEMDARVESRTPAVRHAHTASRDTTVMIHAELAAYLNDDTPSPYVQSLTRDDQTSAALSYREINSIA